MKYDSLLLDKMRSQLTQKELIWIESKENGSNQSLQTAFVITPRFISKRPVESDESINGISLEYWTLDRLVRVYLLTKLNHSDKDAYIRAIDTLFDTAENNEAVALISALPFLPFPDYWLLRATNAVRSNIGHVFDAIAFNNPYPKQYFSELAWNQLVLKCIFNDKPIHKISGLSERANQGLANSISYLAHERWSAGRTITPQAWRLVSRFMNDEIMNDIRYLLSSGSESDNIAAALVCGETDFEPAKAELQKHEDLFKKITANSLSWQILES
jgi:hypothetical protein